MYAEHESGEISRGKSMRIRSACFLAWVVLWCVVGCSRQKPGCTAEEKERERVNSDVVPSRERDERVRGRRSVYAQARGGEWGWEIPDRVRVVYGLEGESFEQRQRVIRGLAENLSLRDEEALVRFLYLGEDAVGLRAGELNALKNEIVNVLKRDAKIRRRLAESLLELWGRGGGVDEVWRNYCLQHLATLYWQVDETVRERIHQAWWAAVEEREGTTAGTALLGMARNLRGESGESVQVAERAAAIAGDEGYSDAARITALQVAAKLGNRKVLEVARRIVEGGGYRVPLKVSAVAVLGMLGDAGDAERLRGLRASSDRRLRKAAEAALERLRGRNARTDR